MKDQPEPKLVIDITGGLVRCIVSEIDPDVMTFDYDDLGNDDMNDRKEAAG